MAPDSSTLRTRAHSLALHAITKCLAASGTAARLTAHIDDPDGERGSSSVELAIILAGVAAIALAVLAVLGKKIITKATGIDLGQ